MPDWLWQGMLWMLLGIIFAIVVQHIYYKKSVVSKDLVWCLWTRRMGQRIALSDPELKMSYKGKDVNDLAVSWIAIWNSGTLAVSKEDISIGNQLRVFAHNDDFIFSAQVVSQSDPSCRVQVELAEDGKQCSVTFEFLNHKHGCVLSVVHTPPSMNALAVVGSIKGANPPRQIDSSYAQLSSLPQRVYGHRVSNPYLIIDDSKKLVPMVISTMLLGSLVGSLSNGWYGVLIGACVGVVIWSPLIILWSGVEPLIRARQVSAPLGLEAIQDVHLSDDYWHQKPIS